ncbi:hypothetical protein [Streptacidiphilus albus]|uniref:hypothetical protein n=1 Tax=Streptacidiphilus albus TaxID=105425 RepID=UPI00068DFC8C|nr:hypothetical protein [Streptacidiphilus albus]
MRDMLRDYLKLAADAAAGAAGEFRRRAESGARELVELSGLDPEQLRAKVPASVLSLAEEVVGAGRSNSELLIGLVRSEADKAWSRLGDGMVQVGVVLELLERQVRALQGGEDEAAPSAEPKPKPEAEREPERESRPKPASRAEQAFPRRAPRPVRVVVDPEDGAASAAAAAAARRRAAVPGMRKVAEGRSAAASARPTEVAERVPARKTAAKKPAAKKTVVEQAAPKQAAPAKAAPRKAATKKAVAEPASADGAAAKKAPAKKAPAKKAVATKAVPTKAPAKTAATTTTAAKKTTAKKTTAKQTVAKKATPKTPATAAQAPARKPRQAKGSAGDE